MIGGILKSLAAVAALGMIGTGVALVASVPIAAIVVGVLIWIDLSRAKPQPPQEG